MKFKIKVLVFHDHNCLFKPMVKKHWYSPWKIIKLRYMGVCATRAQAEEVIKDYQNSILERVFYIDIEPTEE